MLPDTAAHDARVTGENRVGVFTGVWTAIETLNRSPRRLRGDPLYAVIGRAIEERLATGPDGNR